MTGRTAHLVLQDLLSMTMQTEQLLRNHVWFRTFADSTTKQMARSTTKVDLLCEVTLEEFQTMKESNDKINCWYNDFPYAKPR